jgi:hypothetical protein
MKSALFEKANVAENTKLTSDALFVWKFQCFFLNILVRNVQFRYGMTGKFFFPLPVAKTFRWKNF